MFNKILFRLRNILQAMAILSIFIVFSCTGKKPIDDECSMIKMKSTKSNWLGKTVNFKNIKNVINTYHISDINNRKVGSMVFSLNRQGNSLVARDTSQFDDGTIYETAILEVDLNDMEFKSLDMDIKQYDGEVFINLISSEKNVNGSLKVFQDSTTIVDRVIDSTYNYQVFREEIYMLLHTINLNPGDSIPFKMFFPNQVSIVDASIVYRKEETIEVPAGVFETDVIYLNTGGQLDNKIWISKGKNKKLVKFSVPNANLNIELVNSKLL